jgi:uncharacterized OB-fold protein
MHERTLKRVPLVEGRIKFLEDGSSRLIGVRCRSCSSVVFPVSRLCQGCGRDDVEEVELGTRGTVWTYTIVHVGYGSIVLVPPYATAFVELEGGGFVHTPVVGCELEDVRIGMEVELELLPTGVNEGEETVTYAFRPVGSPDDI